MRGFPLRDILSLRALGDGLGQGARIVAAAAAVGVNFLNARFNKEKLQKSMF